MCDDRRSSLLSLLLLLVLSLPPLPSSPNDFFSLLFLLRLLRLAVVVAAAAAAAAATVSFHFISFQSIFVRDLLSAVVITNSRGASILIRSSEYRSFRLV